MVGIFRNNTYIISRIPITSYNAFLKAITNKYKESNLTLRIKYSEEIEKQMKTFYDILNEKDRRRCATIEATELGYGGQIYISNVNK